MRITKTAGIPEWMIKTSREDDPEADGDLQGTREADEEAVQEKWNQHEDLEKGYRTGLKELESIIKPDIKPVSNLQELYAAFDQMKSDFSQYLRKKILEEVGLPSDTTKDAQESFDKAMTMIRKAVEDDAYLEAFMEDQSDEAHYISFFSKGQG